MDTKEMMVMSGKLNTNRNNRLFYKKKGISGNITAYSIIGNINFFKP